MYPEAVAQPERGWRDESLGSGRHLHAEAAEERGLQGAAPCQARGGERRMPVAAPI